MSNKKFFILLCAVLLCTVVGYGFYLFSQQKPDSLELYLKSKGWLNEYALFKPLLRDGKLSDNEKSLIDYFNSLPDRYKTNPKVLGILKDIVNDGKVTENEWKTFQDWDGDTLNNSREIFEYHTDPLTPNPVLLYLMKKKEVGEYNLFKPLDNDGKMSTEEKALIDYFDSLPSKYKNEKEILSILSSIVSDGKVTSSELNKFKDWDLDGFTNTFEIKHNLNPLKANPIYAYLKKNNSLDEYKLFKSLDSDGVMQPEEKALIDYYNSLPDRYKTNPKVLGILKDIVNDGKVTENEWKTFQDWDGDGMSNLFEIYYFKPADPLVHNDRYVIIFSADRPGVTKPPPQGHYFTEGSWECAQRFAGHSYYSVKEFVNGLYDFFVNGEKIPSENFYLYIGKNATVDNLEKVLNDVSKKADENDFVYLFLDGHGNERGYIYFFERDFNGKLKLTGIKYSTIGEFLERIHSKYQVVIVDSCGSESAIDMLKNDHRIILTSVGYERANGLPLLHLLVGLGLSEWYPEDYVSVEKLYKDAMGLNECMCEGMREYFKKNSNPHLYDPNGLANKIYLGDFKKSNNSTCYSDFPILFFTDSYQIVRGEG